MFKLSSIFEDESEESTASEPPDIADAPNDPNPYLISEKSKAKYAKVYERFEKWFRQHSDVEYVTEGVLLGYFKEKSKQNKSSSLYAEFSMLKPIIFDKSGVDIGRFLELRAFLREYGNGYRPEKSKTFTSEETEKFLLEAPDEEYLMIKVAFIMGIAGGCHRAELARMTIDDIQDFGSTLLVTIPDVETKTSRTFTIMDNKDNPLNMLETYRKYAGLRPAHTTTRRFFLYYKSGKCSVQVVGVNTFGRIPNQVATFLKLPDAASYKGHCFRNCSASILSGIAGLKARKRRRVDMGMGMVAYRNSREWHNIEQPSYVDTAAHNTSGPGPSRINPSNRDVEFVCKVECDEDEIVSTLSQKQPELNTVMVLLPKSNASASLTELQEGAEEEEDGEAVGQEDQDVLAIKTEPYDQQEEAPSPSTPPPPQPPPPLPPAAPPLVQTVPVLQALKLEGRRIVDLDHVLKAGMDIQYHHGRICPNSRMTLCKETPSGLVSDLSFKCSKCTYQVVVSTENPMNYGVDPHAWKGWVAQLPETSRKEIRNMFKVLKIPFRTE